MEQEVFKILSSEKCLDRYKRVLHLLNGEDSDKYKKEKQPPRKVFLGWGCIFKNKSVLIIAQKEKNANGYYV